MPYPCAAGRSASWAAILSLGAALAVSPCAAHANLLTNGGFETGSLSPWTGGGATFIDTVFVQGGNFAASLGSVQSEPATLEQDVATSSGGSYTLSFYVLDQEFSAFNALTVTFGGFSTTISGSDAFDPNGVNGFALESFTIDAAYIVGVTTTLRFSALNENAAFSIDDVVLTSNSTQPTMTVPEPGMAILLPMLVMLGVSRCRRTADGPKRA